MAIIPKNNVSAHAFVAFEFYSFQGRPGSLICLPRSLAANLVVAAIITAESQNTIQHVAFSLSCHLCTNKYKTFPVARNNKLVHANEGSFRLLSRILSDWKTIFRVKCLDSEGNCSCRNELLPSALSLILAVTI